MNTIPMKRDGMKSRFVVCAFLAVLVASAPGLAANETATFEFDSFVWSNGFFSPAYIDLLIDLGPNVDSVEDFRVTINAVGHDWYWETSNAWGDVVSGYCDAALRCYFPSGNGIQGELELPGEGIEYTLGFEFFIYSPTEWEGYTLLPLPDDAWSFLVGSAQTLRIQESDTYMYDYTCDAYVDMLSVTVEVDYSPVLANGSDTWDGVTESEPLSSR